MRPRKADLIKRKVKCSITKQGLEGGELNCLKVFWCFFLQKYPGIRLIIAEYLWPLAISDWSPHVFFWYKARFCHLLSWFIFPLLLGKLVSSLFQSSIVKRTRSNYCGLANSNGRRHWNEPVKFQNSPRQSRKNAYQQVMFFNEFWLAEKGV